jgi:8-oxo-dGTP pyrophosphatase MutT (NUDIX family)
LRPGDESVAVRGDRRDRRSAGATRGQSGPRPSLQVGALCWRLTRKGALRVLLITSRDTGRWVIPKGWPMRNRTEAEAAAREAWEEAGVKGEVSSKPLGLYGYPKITPKGGALPCVVRVFPLAVEARSSRFPEVDQRRRKWFSPAKAARKVQEPELARIIRGFRPSLAPSEAEEDATARDLEGEGTERASEPVIGS